MRVQKMVTAGLTTGALCLLPATSFAYGPGGGGNETPPGFGPTLTTCTAGPGDGCTMDADAHKCHIHVHVPDKAFRLPTDVVVSSIANDDADQHLKPPHSSICAFGIGFFRHGHRVHIHGDASHDGTVTITGDRITVNDQLFRLVPRDGSVRMTRHVNVVDGSVRWDRLRHLTELDVVNP